MPYALDGSDVPEYIAKLSAKKRRMWAEVWMSVIGQPGSSESRAYAAANAAVSGKQQEGDMSEETSEDSTIVTETATEEDLKAQQARAAKCGISIIKGKNVTKPSQWASVPDDDFADPTNYAYPISDAAQAVTAFQYFNHPGQRAAGGYSEADWRKIGERIMAKLKGKYSIKGDRIVVVESGSPDLDIDDAFSQAFERLKIEWLAAPPSAKEAVRSTVTQVQETGRRHSQSDIDLIDKAIALLQQARGEEVPEPEPSAQPAKVQITTEADQETAFCPKCGKVMPFAKPPEKGKLLNRVALIGECGKGHKMSKFVKESVESTPQYFGELLPLREATVDAVAHEVELRIIRPGWSENGRYYGPDQVREAAPLFAGIKAYADHPSKTQDSDRPERSVRDIVGYYPKAWIAEDGSLRGVLRVVGEAIGWLWPLIEETVSHGADLVQASINALGEVAPGEVEGRKGNIVKRIIKANSTDVVTQAAAGGQFERLMAGGDGYTDDLVHAMTYEQYLAARPDFVEQMRGEMKTARKDELEESTRSEIAQVAMAAEDKTKRIIELEAILAGTQGALETAVATTEAAIESVRLESKSAKDAVDVEFAKLRTDSAAREATLLASIRILESNIPVQMREEAARRIIGMEAEQAMAELANLRATWRGLVLESGKVPVTGNGPAPVRPQATNPVASIFGIRIVPLDGETPEQYAVRKAAM